jgi:polyphosphate glucokinase
MSAFGLDIGGSGIKGAPVNMETGELSGERIKIDTPKPATPEAIVETAAKVVSRAGWDGPVGCGFPAVIKEGVAQTAANIDKSAIGFDFRSSLKKKLGSEVSLVNDADAAGLAEMRWGAGRGLDGVVLMLTLGTGIGSALFIGGRLIPNTELGHIELHGGDAEVYASDSARKRGDLNWEAYAGRLDEYVRAIEDLLWPDRIIVGGGISKKSEKFIPLLTARTEIVPAQMFNEAGIAGAALAGNPDLVG